MGTAARFFKVTTNYLPNRSHAKWMLMPFTQRERVVKATVEQCDNWAVLPTTQEANNVGTDASPS